MQGRPQYPSCIPHLVPSALRTSKTGRSHPASPTGRTPRGTPSPWTSGWQLMGEDCKRPPSTTALPSSLKPCTWQKARPDKQVGPLSLVFSLLSSSHFEKCMVLLAQSVLAVQVPCLTCNYIPGTLGRFSCFLVRLSALSADIT